MRQMIQDIPRVNASFGLVRRQPTHGPWKAFVIAELSSSARDEQLRHPLLVHVFLDCVVGLGSRTSEDQQHPSPVFCSRVSAAVFPPPPLFGGPPGASS